MISTFYKINIYQNSRVCFICIGISLLVLHNIVLGVLLKHLFY